MPILRIRDVEGIVIQGLKGAAGRRDRAADALRAARLRTVRVLLNLLRRVSLDAHSLLMSGRECGTVLDERLGWKFRDLFSDCLLAIAGIGMVAEKLRCLGACLLFQVLEERGELHRIVSSVVHDA